MRSFHRGMSLVDVIVGVGLFAVVFVGIFGILRASLLVSGVAKQKAIATTVASTQMEYLRSLPYDDIGTVGGIPSGLVPQYASSTNGGLIFDLRTYVEYADDPADGTGGADTNGITTDYKRLKVTASYTLDGITRDVTLVSNAAPQGIESTTGGGTLLLNIVDAVGAALTGATVRIVNASTTPAIDVTTFSDSYGTVNLPGAPASTQYQVYVSKIGHSSAETYLRDATNANPTPGYLTVVAGSTTGGTFAIDELATLVVRTFSPIDDFTWTDPLDDATQVYDMTSAQVGGGALTLSGAPGTYSGSGSARSTTTAPLYLAEWNSATITLSEPLSTDAIVSLADASGTPLPDAVVPGNSAGLSGTVDLSSVSTTTYPALRLVASLTSSDVLATPRVEGWSLNYDAGPTPLGDVPLTLTGAKTIGSTSGGTALYKTTVATTTDATGVRTLSLEWDLYTLVLGGGYTVVTEDPESPYELLPGASVSASLILTP